MVIGKPPEVSLRATSSRRLNSLVVHDCFLGNVGSRADVVLPRAVFSEKEGTYTNLERRVQLLRPAMEAPGEARPESWVLCELAQAHGCGGV